MKAQEVPEGMETVSFRFPAKNDIMTARWLKLQKHMLPVIVEKDEDGYYVVECPLFNGCYSQGKTLDAAVKNIKEVVDICLEEKENKQLLKDYKPSEISFLTLSYA